MLILRFASSFAQSIKSLHPDEKIEVQRRVDALMLALDARQLPAGLGLKKLRNEVWEFRCGLARRVLVRWTRETLTVLFVGNHDEVQRFLKHFL